MHCNIVRLLRYSYNDEVPQTFKSIENDLAFNVKGANNRKVRIADAVAFQIQVSYR